jgi:hypothetical protein
VKPARSICRVIGSRTSSGEIRSVFMLSVAVAHHHEQPFVPQRPRDVSQQEDRRTVGPVRVI